MLLKAVKPSHGLRLASMTPLSTSIFASEIGSLNRDPGIYLVRPLRTRRFSRQKLTQLFRKDRRVVFEWGKAIAATVREVHERDPMDVFEMEESFGWCADVQMRVPVPVVVKLHGPEFLTRIALYGQSEIAPARIDIASVCVDRVNSSLTLARSR